MTCPACGSENRPGRKYCLRCGGLLLASCPACGGSNEPEAAYCGQCGAALADIAGPPSQARVQAPEAPSPAAVAERRLVTVLFADIVGFTAYAEPRDAEEVRETLSRYFDLVSTIVRRYGGTVEKFIGDAVMVAWGTPLAHEDDAERAVRAGLELVDAIPAMDASIQVRVGVLTGEAAVTVGAQGQAMIAGDLVNTASRLQAAAPPGTVLVDEPTMRATSTAIAFEAAGDQVLKGKSVPVPAWRAVRVIAERRGRGRSEILEPPFVGRDEEFRLLKELLDTTGRERRSRLVSIAGIAGIGKTRLAREFLRYVDGLAEDVYWHEGRSPAYGEGVTFWALGEMVRRRAGLAEADDETTTRERIRSTVAEFIPDDAERRWVEPALLALLGIAEVPPGGQESLFAAWRVFFERIAAQATAVLVFEDLQWADDGLLDFIDHLVEWSRNVPLLVVTLSRPELLERRPDWGSRGRAYTSLHLEPLPDTAMSSLITGVAPRLPAAAVAEIVRRADGVPLYAVETLRTLLADGRVLLRDGVIEPTAELGPLRVPDSLHALIASRLDGLAPSDRTLLQDAAVLGQSFTPAALTAVAGDEQPDLARRLRDLVRREFLRIEGDARSPERGQYGFLQALVREVAYATLARRDRKRRHLAAARYFESLGDDELAGALAAHYVAAHDNASDGAEAAALAVQARITLRGAARRAAGLGAHAQALAYLSQALAMAAESADEADLHEAAGLSATALTRFEAAGEHLAKAERLRRELGDRVGAARIIAEQGRIVTHSGQAERALRVLEPAVAEFADLGGEPAVIELGAELARALMLVDENRKAVEVADRVLEQAERLALTAAIVDAFVTKGTALVNLHRPHEGTALIDAGARMAEHEGLWLASLRASVNLSWAQQDEPRRSRATCQAALETARRLGQHDWELMLILNSNDCDVWLGEWDRALESIEVALATEMAPVHEAQFKGQRAIFGAFHGLDSRAEFAEAEGFLATFEQPQAKAGVESAHAEFAFATGDLEAAAEHWRASKAIYTMSASEAWWGLGHIALWERSRGTAETILAELESSHRHSFILDQVARELRAGLAALEGRRSDAVSGFRDLLTRWRAEETAFPLALSEIVFVRLLGPEEPEARQAVVEARGVLERLRAKSLLERLEAALQESHVVGSAPHHGGDLDRAEVGAPIPTRPSTG